MKKLLAICMVLALLLPLGLTAAAEQAPAQGIDEKPYFALGWSEIDEKKFTNLDGLPTINFSLKGDQVTLSRSNINGNVEKLAQSVKTQLDAMPEGTRYLHVWNPASVLRVGLEESIYAHNGAELMESVFTPFIQKYKEIGGQLDGIIIDLEYIDMYIWYVYSRGYYNSGEVSNPEIYQEIVDHPLYATEVRPMLEEYGFTFNTTDPQADNVNGGPKSEIWGIWPSQRKTAEDKITYANCEAIWNTVMRNRLNGYINRAIFEPAKALYPDVTLSDYQSQDTFAWLKDLSDQGGTNYLGGNEMKAGNISNANSYSYRPNGSFYDASASSSCLNLKGYNKAFYEDDPYNMFLFDAMAFKNMYAATDTKTISAWIAEYDYNAEQAGSVSNTPYYAETVLHIGLLDPEPFLIYMYKPAFDSQADYENRLQVISELLSELTRVAGFADRQPIEMEPNWNDGYVLSGMYAGGRNIWRITPDTTDGMTLQNFKISKDGEDPAFSINGKTITFPKGKIIEDSTIGVVGTCGYWIETAADVKPVVTTDPDRYTYLPSYVEDFSAFEAATEFTTKNAKPVGTWTVSAKIPLIVMDVNGNKMLSVRSTATFSNTNIPRNITAGDSYAKQQAWEISVTLPGNMGEGAYAEFLGCGDDGGFRIADGKVYYNENGEFRELPGVAVTAAKYTLRRDVDFGTAGAFKSSYAVYDAEGTLLAEVKDVPMKTVELPVNQIGFACKDVKETILLDDYKLYVTGSGYDFELYDAEFGFRVDDAARTEDTAYRFSWLNHSSGEKTATVVASYYDSTGTLISEEVVRTIMMQPGCDGVNTGIVQPKENTAVKLSLKFDYDNADPIPDSRDDQNVVLIIVIAAACAVGLCMPIAALLLMKKKNNK